MTIPEKMDAVVLYGPNDFKVEQVPVPKPGQNEVLCKVVATAICGTDVHIIEGHTAGRWPKSFPYILGHEWAGEVVVLGEKAEAYGWKIGDRVAGTSHVGCGVCRMCTTGRYNLCENYGNEGIHRQYGHYSQGCYSQYMVNNIKAIHKIPDHMTFEEAALVDTTSIALHSINRVVVEPGDTVAVFGPGAMGLLAVQCAYAVGAARVVVVGSGERLQKAKEYGAEIVNYRETDPVKAILELTGGRGVDASIDCASTSDTVRQCVEVLRKGGRVSYTGIPFEPVALPMQEIVLKELDLNGVRANRGTCEQCIPLIARGKIDVKSLVTHSFPLKEYAKAFYTFKNRTDGALKVILYPHKQ